MMKNRKTQNHLPASAMRLVTVAVLLLLVFAGRSRAVYVRGVDFAAGTRSFADAVIQYDPLYSGGPGPTIASAQNPDDALGPPDFRLGGVPGDPGSVAIGHGGLLELLLTDVLLSNTGDSNFDLYIFEVGDDVEDTFVAVRPTAPTAALLGPPGPYDADGDGFYEVGKVFGSTSFVDIDAFFPGYPAGALVFDAVQLMDDVAEGNTSGATVGADIDAVGVVLPEPTMVALLGLGSLVLLASRRGRTA